MEMKIMTKRHCILLVVLSMIILLSAGCMVLTTGASIISSVIDRYEKYKIEERLEELESLSTDKE